MSDVLVDEYEVAGTTHPSSLAEDLRVDKTNLSDEFAEHSSKFAWYATAYEIAKDHEERLKTGLERAYAQLDVQARSVMESAGVKVTEKKVENMVITNAQYVTLADEYQDAKLQTGLLKAARDAMSSKKDCLVSLGANIRAELANDPSLLMEQYRKNHG